MCLSLMTLLSKFWANQKKLTARTNFWLKSGEALPGYILKKEKQDLMMFTKQYLNI